MLSAVATTGKTGTEASWGREAAPMRDGTVRFTDVLRLFSMHSGEDTSSLGGRSRIRSVSKPGAPLKGTIQGIDRTRSILKPTGLVAGLTMGAFEL